MSAAQVQAARVIIGKVIPDLKSVEVTGDSEKPIEANNNHTVRFVKSGGEQQGERAVETPGC